MAVCICFPHMQRVVAHDHLHVTFAQVVEVDEGSSEIIHLTVSVRTTADGMPAFYHDSARTQPHTISDKVYEYTTLLYSLFV